MKATNSWSIFHIIQKHIFYSGVQKKKKKIPIEHIVSLKWLHAKHFISVKTEEQKSKYTQTNSHSNRIRCDYWKVYLLFFFLYGNSFNLTMVIFFFLVWLYICYCWCYLTVRCACRSQYSLYSIVMGFSSKLYSELNFISFHFNVPLCIECIFLWVLLDFVWILVCLFRCYVCVPIEKKNIIYNYMCILIGSFFFLSYSTHLKL